MLILKKIRINKMNNKKLSVLLLAIGLFVITTVSNAQLNLLFPENNSTCVEYFTAFKWSSVNNIKFYKFYFSTTSSFNIDSTITINTGTDTTLSTENITNITSQTKYYWKVVATLNNDQIVNSNVFNFTTNTEPLLMVFPGVDESCLDKKIGFVVKTPYTKIDSLRILIASNRSFSSKVKDTTIANPVIAQDGTINVSITVPNYNTSYYWVAFQNKNGCWADSLIGQATKFTTRVGPTTLVSPANGSFGIPLFQNGLPFNVTFKWKTIPQALNYVIQVSTSAQFNTFTEYRSTDTTLSITLPNDYNQTYYWRVYAKTQPITMNNDESLDSCNTEISSSYSFKTPYQPVTLSFPNNGDKCIPIILNFAWNSVTNAQFYRIQIAKSDTFADSTIVIDVDSVQIESATLTLPEGITKYYWRVRVDNPINIGLWSETRYFETTAKTPVAVYPVNTQTGVPKTADIQWTAGIPNTSYNLQISTTYEMENKLVDTIIYSNTFHYTFPNYNAKYYWKVKAFYNDCQSTWSDVYNMKTVIAPPTLTYPKNDSTGIEPVLVSLRWTGSQGTEKYDFDISDDSTFTNLKRWERNIVVNSVIMDNLAENTRYWWRVRGKNAEGTSQWSTVYTFKTGYIRPSVPVLLTPANGTTKLQLSVDLTWQASSRAEKYILQVSDANNFSNLIINIDTLSTTTFNVNNLINNKIYFWRVAAKNIGGVSDWSSVFSFKTIPLAPTAKVTLLSPQNGVKNLLTKSLELTWNKIDSADVYELQIAHDADFKDMYYFNDKVWTTSKILFNLEPLTKYYWRVRGANDGGTAPWSDVWTFETEDPASVQTDNYFKTEINPLPVVNLMKMKFNLENSNEINLQILDLSGKIIFSRNYSNLQLGNNEIEINTESLPSNTYIYKISTGQKQQIGKFIISK